MEGNKPKEKTEKRVKMKARRCPGWSFSTAETPPLQMDRAELDFIKFLQLNSKTPSASRVDPTEVQSQRSGKAPPPSPTLVPPTAQFESHGARKNMVREGTAAPSSPGWLAGSRAGIPPGNTKVLSG